jgi:prepilin-type N-terminal cleavage/methylation domain-containing protein
LEMNAFANLPRSTRTVSSPPRSGGFTLIELLVVIGIIAVLAGAIGIGLRGGDQTVALQGGQSTVASLISATRGRAALANQDAALMVNANDPADTSRYLRLLAVGVKDGSGNFVPTGDGILLPAGIYVVPPGGPSAAQRESGANWANLDSNALTGPVAFALDGVTSEQWYTLQLSLYGTRTGGIRLVLSRGERTETGLIFTNEENVRGLEVSQYGAVTLIDSADAFRP